MLSQRRRAGTGRTLRVAAVLLAAGTAQFGTMPAIQGSWWQPSAQPVCRISGRVTSGGIPLPGVSIAASADGTVRGATSTDPDGTFRLPLPAGRYDITVELTGFSPAAAVLPVAGDACPPGVDFQLTLAPRVPPRAAEPASARVPAASGPGRSAGGTGAAPSAGARFATLDLQPQAAAAAPSTEEPDAARLLLPPGFSGEAPAEAVAVNGSMASLDRGMLNDRLDAIGRGDFDPVSGEFAQGAGPGGRGFGGPGGGLARGGPGGREGGPGGFVLGGRGRSQNAYNLQANYAFGGSALDSAPYQIRPGAAAQERPYSRQTAGITAGGPLRIKGLYRGDRRTNLMASYAATRGGDLFDQYGTVPDAAMRAGDFGAIASPILDPVTGLAFEGNRIPASRLSPAALALLAVIPNPNLEGDGRNYRRVATSTSSADTVNLRVTHNFTPSAAGRGGAGRGGGMRPPGLRGGRGQAQGTSVVLNGQLQYRRTTSTQNSLFAPLDGETRGSSLSLPLTLNVQRRRTGHTVTVTYARTISEGTNLHAFVEDIAGGAGIAGVSTDPFDWGVPQLSFSSISGIRDMTPSRRRDRRVSAAYGWTRPAGTKHTLRAGGDVRVETADSRTDANARGAFVFTGLYTSGGAGAVRGSGHDVADFLLGLPQQASLQYGPGTVRTTGRSVSAYLQDEWRRSASLTLNLGVRYEFVSPFRERGGQMVNLDVAPGFTAAVPVLAGAGGPFSGRFPAALVRADTNNIAPRAGIAWRVRPRTIVRGGYGVSYNAGSYPSIARQLAAQPPFSTARNAIGTRLRPLSLSDPFAAASPADVTNTYGIDPGYALGLVQTWNADVSREIRRVWSIGAGYTTTRGSSLDIVRAPNRGPAGLRIPGVQPFLWQTSEGASVLHAATFRAARRPAGGVGAGVTYTLAKSRDNASSVGGGTTVAQDDRNLAAEWGLSSFDRRHSLAANLSLELPFGPDRRWLSRPGVAQAIFRDWRLTAAWTVQSGTPLTPRVSGAVADVARGVNGTLRADYTGQPVRLSAASLDRFFNTAAFAVPSPGAFGSAARNMIPGPGSRLLNAQFARDVRLRATRTLTLQLNATNLLNTVNYGAVDTVVNSPTFGQVLSVRGMRSMQLALRFRF